MKLKKIGIVQNYVHIWNQPEICIKMSTNKPMFGPVDLEIACDILYKQDIFERCSL